MPTQKKVETTEYLQDLMQRGTVAIVTDYRGLKMAELTALRRKLREANVEFHIVKNTLGRLAAERSGRKAYLELLSGPTAMAIGFGDQVEAARTLTEYIRTSRLNLPLRGGVLEERVLQAADVQTLASLPTREVLLAQLMGGMQAPITGFVTGLNQIITGFARVLDARAKQLAES